MFAITNIIPQKSSDTYNYPYKWNIIHTKTKKKHTLMVYGLEYLYTRKWLPYKFLCCDIVTGV